MKPGFYASLLAFSLVFAFPVVTHAAPDTSDSRYFVPTSRSFWRGAMGARHVFADGFTADLSDLQLGVAKLAGLKPVQVNKYNVLADEAEAVVTPTPQTTPSQSVSWGVRVMLGDLELRKTSGGSGVSIALVDTGVDRMHPDLERRITGCYDVTDPVQGLLEGTCDDLNGHGTHVAGILVADGGPDGAGSYGFAPGASLSVYRACNPAGSCFADDIATAVTHATDGGADIIVLGFGSEEQSPLVHDAIAYATEHDVLVVAGAGNDGPYDDSVDCPARYPLTVSVAAIDNADEPAEFSSRGLNAATESFTADEGDIEFAAPGVNIESTYLEGGYAILSGTSMAAPHVAGLAAILWQADAEHPADATRTLLHENAHDIGEPGDDAATGWGLPIAPVR